MRLALIMRSTRFCTCEVGTGAPVRSAYTASASSPNRPAPPLLRLHTLRGELEGLRFVSIKLSYRITLELFMQDGQIIPVNVGDHDAVY